MLVLGHWLLNLMTLPTPAKLANGYMALTNGTSHSRPHSRSISYPSGEIVVNMDPEPNIKKMDTVVKIDAVSRCAMLLYFRKLLGFEYSYSYCGSVCFTALRLMSHFKVGMNWKLR